MDYFYSPTTRGFYLEVIHGKSIPKDAVKVSEVEHEALMKGQSYDMDIVPDDKGHPVLRKRDHGQV